jgi:hypothetical protein
MVMVVKSEWHQVEKRYGLEVDTDLLEQIYPDSNKKEIKKMLSELKSGEISIDTIMDEAWENNVDIDWDWLDEDDWWTDRKGGYEVTYEVQG